MKLPFFCLSFPIKFISTQMVTYQHEYWYNGNPIGFGVLHWKKKKKKKITLNHAKMAFPIVKVKDIEELFLMTKKFEESILQLRDFFLERNYPATIVNEALGNVSSLRQDEALQTSIKTGDKNVIPFVIEYNPSLPNIGLVINKYWDLLHLSQSASVNSVHAYKPILAFKRPKNLRDYLVHSSFVDETHHFSQTCDRRRCSHCKNIIKTDVFTSRSTSVFQNAVFNKLHVSECHLSDRM